MKGKGIQVTNKAYRDGWERTFRKDSEIPSLLDSLRDVNSYTKEELKEITDQLRENKVYAITNEEITDPESWVKANFIERTEVCVEEIETKPLMEGWIDQLVSFAGLHDDYLDRAIFTPQDERK